MSAEDYRVWLRSRHRPAHGRRTAEHDAAFFLPHLGPDMRVLDVGCGPGAITLGLAARVPRGAVVGVDQDVEGLEVARSLAQASAVTNVEWFTANVYALPFDDQAFDAAFMHAVVQHLHDPAAAVREVQRVLRPGAVLGVADADLSLDVLHPETPCLRRSMQLFADLRRADGGTPDAGRRLRELLSLAGFARSTTSARAIAAGTPDAVAQVGERWAKYFSAEPLIDRVLATGLATRDELLEMSNDWRAWATSTGAFCTAIWCEAVGWK